MSGNHSRLKQWRTLPWLPGYEIAEDGEIRHTTPKATRSVGHVVRGCVNLDGYRKVKLATPEGKRQLAVHRLVCEAFHGPAKAPFYQVAHNDGCPDNNHYTNLRWTTCLQNQRDRHRHNTDARGERNGRAILSRAQVDEARSRYTGAYGQIAELSREFSVSHSTMSQVIKGARWK